jgi:hypothetical protein
MVPEYLTPNNGGLLSPGQLMGLSHAVFLRFGGPQVAELVLEITPDVMVGKVRHTACWQSWECCRSWSQLLASPQQQCRAESGLPQRDTRHTT